ncbi:uncharacterized protein LOC136025430 [Artemia franciscana]|uniref:uncharacterized protein LOC136025430 n=1 Tax=Artemia franciscana TaxID=6661 RepID=UPI0032DA3F9A
MLLFLFSLIVTIFGLFIPVAPAESSDPYVKGDDNVSEEILAGNLLSIYNQRNAGVKGDSAVFEYADGTFADGENIQSRRIRRGLKKLKNSIKKRSKKAESSIKKRLKKAENSIKKRCEIGTLKGINCKG